MMLAAKASGTDIQKINKTPIEGQKGRSERKKVLPLTIRARLTLLLLVVLVPVIMVSLYNYHDRFVTGKQHELQTNLEIARAVGKAFDGFVQDVLHQELAIGIAITASPPLSEKEILKLLDDSAKEYPAIRHFNWVSPQGRIVLSNTASHIGLTISDRPSFQEILSGREWAVNDLVHAVSDGSPVIAIDRGIRNADGTLLGIVHASIDPNRLDNVLAIDRSSQGAVSLVDSKGMLVYRHPHIAATWDERNWLKAMPYLSQALAGEEIATIVTPPYEKYSRIVANVPIESIGWSAGAGRREDEVLRPIISTILFESGILLGVVALSLLAAISIVRSITTPASRLRDRALSLGSGDLTSKIKPDGAAELQDLAHAFNEMAERVRKSRDELELRVEERTKELAQAYKDLKEKTKLLEAFFSHSITPLVFLDRDFNLIRVNEAYAKACNLTVEEFAGRNHFELYPHAENEEIFRKVVKTKEPYTAAAKPFIFPDHPEWGVTYWDWTLVPMLDDIGEVEFLVFSLKDVTEKKKAELALKESKQFLEKTFSAISDAILIEDPSDRTIITCNDAVETIFGYQPRELVGKSVEWLHVNREMYEQFGKDFCPALESEGVFHSEFHMRRKDGTVFPTEHLVTQIWDHRGMVSHIVISVRDITERKQAEEQIRAYTKKLEQSNQALQDFTSIASHDMQEPLRKIIGFGDRLKDRLRDSIGETERDYLERMQRAAIRMRTLLNALLEFSRVSTKPEPFVPVSLQDLIQEVVDDLEVRITETGGTVEVGSLPTIDADPHQARQLFQNLIGNALKYHGERKPVVKVQGEPVNSGDAWMISIEDNGIGFEEGYVEKIFEPFQRLHGRESAYDGTGMGLAICKKIVERHGGSISAKSTPSVGSTFVITLPAQQPKEHK